MTCILWWACGQDVFTIHCDHSIVGVILAFCCCRSLPFSLCPFTSYHHHHAVHIWKRKIPNITLWKKYHFMGPLNLDYALYKPITTSWINVWQGEHGVFLLLCAKTQLLCLKLVQEKKIIVYCINCNVLVCMWKMLTCYMTIKNSLNPNHSALTKVLLCSKVGICYCTRIPSAMLFLLDNSPIKCQTYKIVKSLYLQ